MSNPTRQQPNTSSTVVVLLSGGLDSSVAMAEALQTQTIACALTFDYGQRAAQREIQASQVIAAHYRIPHRVIQLPWLAELLPKALSAQQETGEAWHRLDEQALYELRRVWVPNRNGLLLNAAACFAEAMGAQHILFGANAEEGADFPDNTPEFRDRLNASLAYSTLSGVTAITPVSALRKNAIVQLGQRLNVPFQLIWSCYEGGETPCNACPSCLRLNAAKLTASSLPLC
jgi:7-cyano-7-deazaguanine synthase